MAVYSVPGRLATLHLTPLHRAATHAGELLVERDAGILPLCVKLLSILGGSASKLSAWPVYLGRLGVLSACQVCIKIEHFGP